MQIESVPETGSGPLTSADTPRPTPTAAISATAPGQLKVIKRNGTVVSYSDDKIAVALTKAFLAVEGGTAAASPRIRELVGTLTQQVSKTFRRRLATGGTMDIEEIQDQVELALMRSGEHKVARSYVLYRDERARLREQEAPIAAATVPAINVTLANGQSAPLDLERLNQLVMDACAGLSDVSGERIITEALANMYDGISEKDVATSLMITARTLIEEEPNYSYVTARLLQDELRAEGLGFMGVGLPSGQRATHSDMAILYPQALAAFIERGVQLELLDPALKRYDLAQLGAAIKPERDQQFTYLGLQTLYDRYFIHSDDITLRVAADLLHAGGHGSRR